jgi:hypothetical protein
MHVAGPSTLYANLKTRVFLRVSFGLWFLCKSLSLASPFQQLRFTFISNRIKNISMLMESLNNKKTTLDTQFAAEKRVV